MQFLYTFLSLIQKEQQNHTWEQVSPKTDMIYGKHFHEGSILCNDRTLFLPPGQTGCGAHPVSYNICTMRSSPGDKTPMA